MNQAQEHARPSPLPLAGSAVGRTIETPPLGRPTTLDHDQMATHSQGWGAPLWQCCAFPPVRVSILRGQGGSFSHFIDPPVDWGRLRSARFFSRISADRCGSSRPVAIAFHALRERVLKSFRQGLPSHSLSLRSMPNHLTGIGGQTIGYRGQNAERCHCA